MKDLEAAFHEDLPDRIKVRPARYRFLTLKRWHARLLKQAAKIDGITLTDIDDAKNRLLVGLRNAKARAPVGTQLEKLAIPQKAVRIVNMGPVEAHSSLNDFSHHLGEVGGLEIWNYKPDAKKTSRCTLVLQ